MRLFGLLLFFLTACSSVDTPQPTDSGFSFIVIGDTPYGQEDEVMLDNAVPVIRNGDYPFVIHVGDIKGGGEVCTDALEERLENLITSLAPAPVFYTPGDNDWTDCDRFDDPSTGKKASELDRLDGLRARFFNSNTPATQQRIKLNAVNQKSLPENTAWRYGGVYFFTLHVVRHQ